MNLEKSLFIEFPSACF